MADFFPPFPIPDYIPDFSNFDSNLQWYTDIDWEDVYKMIAPNDSLEYVSGSIIKATSDVIVSRYRICTSVRDVHAMPIWLDRIVVSK